VSEEQHNESPRNLIALLETADIMSTEGMHGRRLVPFTGRYRDWSFAVSLDSEWLTIQAFVCKLPDIATLKAALLEEAMAINHRIAIGKFALAGALSLEAEYRAEHIDAEVLSNILTLLHNTAEEHYPRLFRVMSGDATLESLGNDLNLKDAA
jgi:hypothetical protein